MKCSACGAESARGARFCASCGQELLLRGDERRVVTVLFGDLVGFTELAETLDPEKVKQVVDLRFERLVEIIERFGGRVDKIIGDAIVALFGAPVAHEDDAERAVRAALAMQAAMASFDDGADDRVEMRIGVNTGEVLVGALRAGGDYTAMGDVVNTASRLQTHALPSQVLVGPETQRATRDVVSYEAPDAVAMKGRAETVRCWIAIAAVAPPGRRPNRPLVPLVGRVNEMSLLTGAVATTASRSRASMLLVSGEPGVGKSRILEEVASWAENELDALVLHGRCVPYGEANVWWPVSEALRHGIGIEPDDDLATARAATAETVADEFEKGTSDSEIDRISDGLLHLMGHETMTGVDITRDHDEAIGSLVAFVRAACDSRPVLVVLSDMHWADDRVLELIDTLLERLDHDRYAVVATTRPSLTERWKPSSGHHSLVVLHLDPLSSEASRTLISELGGDQLEDVLVDELLERSGGNPFFLEELMSLMADVDDASDLPSSLRGLVAARLDALGPSERAVLDDAAVLGRRGRLNALETMVSITRGIADVPASIDELIHREMLKRDGRHWEFRSDLVREVAYSMLTKIDRAERHAGIAAWCAEHQDVQQNSVIERIANHYARAAQFSADFGTVPGVPENVDELARTWLVKAAGRAERADLGREASRLYTEALALRSNDDAEKRLLRLGRARGLLLHSDYAGARLDIEAVLDDASASADERQRMQALTLLGDCVMRTGHSHAAADHLADALALAERLGDEHQRAEILRLRGMSYVLSGDDVAARIELSAALELFESLDDQGGVAWVLQHLSWSAFTAGRPDEAEKHLRRAVDTFAARGDSAGLGWALGLYAWVTFHLGDPAGAEWLANQVLDAGLERGDRWGVGMMQVLLANIMLWGGRTDEAVESARRAVAAFDEIEDRFGASQADGTLGRALSAAGLVDEAKASFDADRNGLFDDELEQQRHVAELLAAVQVGDLGWAASVSRKLEPISAGHLGTTEQRVALLLAALQRGEVDVASEMFDFSVSQRPDASGFVLAASALLGAATGEPDQVHELLHRVLDAPRSTYLDRSTARLSAALVTRGADGRALLAEALEELEKTGDRVARLIIHLADAALAEGIDSADQHNARSAADRLGEELGVTAEGWRRYIDLVVGSADRSALPTT